MLGAKHLFTTTDGIMGVVLPGQQIEAAGYSLYASGLCGRTSVNIRAEGAQAEITDMNYDDDTVRYTSELVQKNGWIIVQDTAWDGYTRIPLWIMQGYMTMALEAYEQLPAAYAYIFCRPGSALWQVLYRIFADIYGSSRLTFIVEPKGADCLYQTAANDGSLHSVTGRLETMAGLAYREPNSIAWEILGNLSDGFISCPDYTLCSGNAYFGKSAGG